MHEPNAERLRNIYVDVDDTFVRSVGTERIPMPEVIEHIRSLKAQGARLYCWSSGGAEYARRNAEEFGIEECFVAFLPKPDAILDDMDFKEWRRYRHIRPEMCASLALDDYRLGMSEKRGA